MCTSNAPTSMIEQGIVSLSCLPMRARAGGRRHAEGCKYFFMFTATTTNVVPIDFLVVSFGCPVFYVPCFLLVHL